MQHEVDAKNPASQKADDNLVSEVLDTMCFDTCGITHATGMVVPEHCIGCGECIRLKTHQLSREVCLA
ncbi:MAG: hypothetical protein KAT70_03780 [Thermoplasmata archaeon]|nr:hypothetical protein [Thermoplasmata archaeon]